MPKLLLICVVSVAIAGDSAWGATLLVPDQFTSIQSAITASADGDTVLIRNGTYHEALGWASKDITLIGENVPPAVVITGSSASKVIGIGPGVTHHTVIENLTIRDGRAEAGAGLELVSADPTIRKCRFEANVAAHPTAPSRGGALFVSSESNPLVTDCSFIENWSIGSTPVVHWWGDGGAIYVQPGGTLEVRRCRFEENEAWGFEGGRGGAIHLNGEASAVIDSCSFNSNYGNGGGVWSMWQVAVSHCVFQGNNGDIGAAVYAIDGACSIQDSQFFENIVTGYEGGTIVLAGSEPGQVTNNTIAFNEGWNEMAGISAPDATVEGNIIAMNTGWAVFDCPVNPENFGCNDVWGNTFDGTPTNYNGCDMTGLNGNISLDPLFCNPATDDYQLQFESPCTPSNSPPGCGLIGALPVGCGVLSVDEGGVARTQVGLLVRPNPVSHVVEFLLSGNVKSSAIEIYNGAGRLVDVVGPISAQMSWVVPRSTPSGVYFARLRGDGFNRAVRFVVVR
jgi:hypothetical protein